MSFHSVCRNSIWLTLLFGCAHLPAAQQAIDCTLPHTDTQINQCTVVKRASEFGQCIRASDVPEHACVVMDADLSFCDGSESINFTAMFNESDRALNCAGGTIDHGWSPSSSETITPTLRSKQKPFIRFNDDRSLSNITIKNCTMRGTFHAAIQMTRFFGGELGGDGKLSGNEPLPIGHRNITMEDLKIEGGQVGIYLGNFSENITMRRVHIDGTKRIAIYSEAGSHKINILDSTISNNQTREAVAIDSTYNSEIRNTVFVNNREGGINLYQNCGELKGSVCPVVRPTPPNNNRIIGNTFINNGISAVQVASRQGRNHSLGWCASLNGLPGQFTDTSENNTLENNTITCNEGTGLVVMDGPNTVRNNTIVAKGECTPYEISTGGFGASKSSVLKGLVVEDNQIESVRPPRLRHVGDGVTVQ